MDPVHFSGKEILEMAVRIEENGLQFYNDAAKASKDAKLKALFKKLAEDEGQHIKTFKELVKYVTESTSDDPYFSEATPYLQAMADSEVFTSATEGKEFASIVQDEKDALDYAIGMEKDSLLFYYELQRMIREKDKVIVESLIKQEQEHYRLLSSMRSAL